ncbi:hypothetical protein CQW29_18780 [Pantoea coffeiphila]|uniref:Uncharacterized protein n=1 Tax=Pantoea coffeiphila TaxID=1465635 RepID=A0A2S9I8C8_9GAMM|nr:hypothetical protein CQW29_18780 [Pantoea coffeiphila]
MAAIIMENGAQDKCCREGKSAEKRQDAFIPALAVNKTTVTVFRRRIFVLKYRQSPQSMTYTLTNSPALPTQL